MTLIVVVYCVLFIIGWLAFLVLRAGHHGQTYGVWFGLVCLVLAIILQQCLLDSLFGLSIERLFEYANQFADWLSRMLGEPRFGRYADRFFQEKHFATVLMNAGMLVGAMLVWPLLRLFLRSARAVPPEALPTALRGRENRRFYKGLLLGCALFAIAHAILLPFGRASDWSSINLIADELYNGLEGIAWAGPLIFLMTLVGATRPVPMAALLDAARSIDNTEAEASNRVREMLDYVAETYPGQVVVMRDFDPPSPVVPDGGRRRRVPGVSDALVDAILRCLGPDASAEAVLDVRRGFNSFWSDAVETPGLATTWRNVLFPEDLRRAHLRVVLEVMRACHDQGGLTLVLAPDPSLPRLREALKEEAGGDRSEFTELWGQPPDEPFVTNKEYSALFFSEQSLETWLLSGEGAAPRALRRLRMIVAFHFHNIEASLLRLRLRRLADACQGAPIRVICQSENRSGLQAAVANTFAPLGRAMYPTLVRLGRQHDTTRHVVVWTGDEATIDELKKREKVVPTSIGPLEVPPLAALPALKFDLTPTFLDMSDRLDPGSWDRVAGGVRADNNLSPALHDVQTTAGRLSRSNADCVIVEDTGNLVEALAHARNHAGPSEYVLMISATRYAMRDWMLDLLRTQQDQLKNDSKLPVAADPRGGITELAMVLAGEFSQRNGVVPQRKVAALFHQQRVRDGIAHAFGLFPTPKGLGTLFQRETGATPGVSRRVEPDHAIMFKIGAHDYPLLAPRLTVRAAPAGFLLAPGDHGLLYAETTTLHRDRQLWSIEHVGQEEIVVQAAKAPESTSRERFHFQRLYDLTFSLETLAPESPGRMDRYGPGQRHRFRQIALRGQFRRMTTAFLRLPEAATPIGDRRLPSWSDTNILVSQKHAAVLLLRIEQSVIGADAAQQRERVEKAAFTLAATLQDVLCALFPLYAHRIAVISPQAEPMIAATLDASSNALESDPTAEVNRFPIDMYPRLVPSAAIATDGSWCSRDTRPANLAATEDEIGRFLNAVDPRADAADTVASHCLLDLIVIEDADHDLGLVHALNNVSIRERALTVWRDFLRWLAQDGRATQPSFYYAFGAGQLPECFDFEGALAIVDRLTANLGEAGGA